MIKVKGDQGHGHSSSWLLFHDHLWLRCIPSFFTAGASKPTWVRTVGDRRIQLCPLLVPRVLRAHLNATWGLSAAPALVSGQ